MVCRLSAAIAAVVAGCIETPDHTAIGPAPAHGHARLYPLPEECKQTPYRDGPPWHRMTGTRCDGVQRALDGGWVMIVNDAVEAYDRYGQLRWRSGIAHGEAEVCGAVRGFAVDAVGRTVVGCGYSLLAFAADGAFLWQVWPGGNHDITAPVVDHDGTIYAGVEGTLYAIAPDDGATRWTIEMGPDTWFSAITATTSGDLLIQTGMAPPRHACDKFDGCPFEYDWVTPELIVIDRRRGAILTRDAHAHSDHWPVWLDLLGERGGRLP